MRTLLFAAILYLIGVIVVLLVRPTLMFDDSGNWKEFGTADAKHTIFPFWLFCIVWAVASYIICILFFKDAKDFGSAGVVGAAAMAHSHSMTETPEDLVPVLPSKTRGKKAPTITTPYGNMKPGYYVLDAKELKKTGIPKYLYVDVDSEPVALGKDMGKDSVASDSDEEEE